MIRIGIGYDVHGFANGRKLILGGVQIDFEQGLDGVSDADVLVHAVMDSILGALALGDIGVHFPPGSPEYKDINSLLLLGKVIGLIRERNYTVGNIDSVIVADKPRLSEYIFQMRENISAVCGIPLDRVSVKATTEEGLALSGRGMAAHCVCILEPL
jgi:2-C-methyl-D-erythritol 2,4-cyclodiphosphate synthase